MKEVIFISDKVTIKFNTRVDGSAIVQFEVGEYNVDQLKELIEYTKNKAVMKIKVTEE